MTLNTLNKSILFLGLTFLSGYQVIAQSLDITPLPNSNLENMSVLLFESDFGGDHGSAAQLAQGYWEEFSQQIGFSLEITNSAGDMNAAKLSSKDIVVINYTANVYNKFNSSQKQAFENYVNGGGHVIGFHTASMPRDGQWEWYRHNVIVGLYNPDYHGLQNGRMVKTTDSEILDEAIMTGMPDAFQASDEWYAFNQGDFFEEAKVLYYIDESSMNSHGHSHNLDAYQLSLPVEIRHPIMWVRENSETGSRVFYTGIIHAPAGANTDFFKLTILRAAEYVSGIEEIPGCPWENYEEYNPDRTVDDTTLCLTVDVVFPGLESTQWVQEGNAIKLYIAKEGDFKGIIRNVSGKVMANFDVKGKSLQQLSTSELEAGLYVIQIVTPGKTLKRKILLQ